MPRPDFADPDNRARVEQLTRADDSLLEIVLGSIQSCASGRSWLREIPGLHACPVAHDQHFTCQRKPTRVKRMGIGNGIEITHAVKGVGALPCGNSADRIIGNVRSYYWLKNSWSAHARTS